MPRAQMVSFTLGTVGKFRKGETANPFLLDFNMGRLTIIYYELAVLKPFEGRDNILKKCYLSAIS